MYQAAGGKEKNETGWVKVSREIQEHWVWDEKPFSRGQAWIDLILLAKHSDGKFTDRRGNIVDGKRGCVYRSERFLAERWGWSRKKLGTFLSRLGQDGMINVDKKRASKGTAVFIVNYEAFQGIGASERASKGASGEPVESQWEASGEPVGNIYKNVKNVKNEKKEKDIVGPGGPTPPFSFALDGFEMQCVEVLIASCLETCPKSRVPDTPEKKQKWAVEIEKMKRLDHLSEEEIRQSLQFAMNDGFWKSNIRSTKKFREKFEVLYSQSQGKDKGEAVGQWTQAEARFGREMQ